MCKEVLWGRRTPPFVSLMLLCTPLESCRKRSSAWAWDLAATSTTSGPLCSTGCCTSWAADATLCPPSLCRWHASATTVSSTTPRVTRRCTQCARARDALLLRRTHNATHVNRAVSRPRGNPNSPARATQAGYTLNQPPTCVWCHSPTPLCCPRVTHMQAKHAPRSVPSTVTDSNTSTTCTPVSTSGVPLSWLLPCFARPPAALDGTSNSSMA